MKFLLPFLLIFMVSLSSFTDENTLDYCPEIEEEEAVTTLVKICTFASMNTGGNGSSCTPGSLELTINDHCIGTAEGAVRAVNLFSNPVVGHKYFLLPGMPDIYYKYTLPNGSDVTVGPITKMVFYGDSITTAHGNVIPVFEYRIPITIDVSEECQSSQTPNIPLLIRLEDSSGSLYPIQDYADSNEAFYCQVFEETCDDCSETVFGCTGGYPPEYNAIACGDCNLCVNTKRSATAENDYELKATENIIVTVQPNPFDELLNVEYSIEKESTVQYSIFNSKGELVYHQEIWNEGGDHNIKISTVDLSAGIYFFRINSASKVNTKKLVKF